jgi:hypothetical protein
MRIRSRSARRGTVELSLDPIPRTSDKRLWAYIKKNSCGSEEQRNINADAALSGLRRQGDVNMFG